MLNAVIVNGLDMNFVLVWCLSLGSPPPPLVVVRRLCVPDPLLPG